MRISIPGPCLLQHGDQRLKLLASGSPLQRKGVGKSFRVPANEIRSNKYDLSISCYKQIEHKEIEYEEPDLNMEKVMALAGEIAQDI